MDHIANEMGISKKTIYNFFENKTELVKEVTSYMFNSITKGITEIKKTSDNPISEIYDTNPGYFSWINNAEFPRYTKKVLKELVNSYKLKKKFEN